MKSLSELYRIGRGPSSSHTMGPQHAAHIFKGRYPAASRFEVTLYGSLAATGKGHMTDVAIMDELKSVAPCHITWNPEVFLSYHPNGMKFEAFDEAGAKLGEWTVYSVGGGALSEGKAKGDLFDTPEVYDLNKMTDIMHWCEDGGANYWEYVDRCEGPGIWDELQKDWEVMQWSAASTTRGGCLGRST